MDTGEFSVIQFYNYQNYHDIISDETTKELNIDLQQLIMKPMESKNDINLVKFLKERKKPLKLTFERKGKAAKAEGILQYLLAVTRYNPAYIDLTLKIFPDWIMIKNILFSEHLINLKLESAFPDHVRFELFFELLSGNLNSSFEELKPFKSNLKRLYILCPKRNMGYDLNVDNASHFSKTIAYIGSVLIFNRKLRILKLSFLENNEFLNNALQANYSLFDSNFQRGEAIHRRNLKLYHITQKNALFLIMVKKFGFNPYLSFMDYNILIKIGKLVFDFKEDIDHLRELEKALKNETSKILTSEENG